LLAYHLQQMQAQSPPGSVYALDLSGLQRADVTVWSAWRGEALARVRKLIQEADPGVLEEWKWGIPVWSHDGIICTGESYKDKVKLTFAKGAFLADPKGLFNASLEGNVRRAIDLREHDRIDAAAFRALFREAVKYNREHPPKRRAPR
jgi:hypothetical protein